jgi:hypothetical protein
MYAQVEKPKENKNKTVANPVLQKKNTKSSGLDDLRGRYCGKVKEDKCAPLQLMSVANGKGVIRGVRNEVPNAANIIADIAKDADVKKRNLFKQYVLNSIESLHPFGSTDIGHIAERAHISKLSKSGVCDNFYEMVIAEVDRLKIIGSDSIHYESYPGHSYVSVKDSSNKDDGEDLIIDAWRVKSAKRKDMKSDKYKNKSSYTQGSEVKLSGTTDWLDGAKFVYDFRRGFLNMMLSPDTGDIEIDINSFMSSQVINSGGEYDLSADDDTNDFAL